MCSASGILWASGRENGVPVKRGAWDQIFQRQVLVFFLMCLYPLLMSINCAFDFSAPVMFYVLVFHRITLTHTRTMRRARLTNVDWGDW